MNAIGYFIKIDLPARTVTVLSLALVLLTLRAPAQSLQPVSSPDPQLEPYASAGGDSSLPVVTFDGRYVAFASTANNLVLLANSVPLEKDFPPKLNVYVRDRVDGTTALASISITGTSGGNGHSVPLGLSYDGQFVLFESDASNLSPGDTNAANDIFLRDMVAGTTILVSVGTSGSAAKGASRNATMTPDGRYVAFASEGSNLVPGDTNGIADVFVRDIQAGATVLASVGAVAVGGALYLNRSDSPAITPDGRYVAFYSTATNLVPAAPKGGDVYVRDLSAGTTTWVSIDARSIVRSNLYLLDTVSCNHVISDDGQFVAFETSSSPGLVLRYNLATGLTDLVHANALGASIPYENASDLDMTPDGRFIAFVARTNGSDTCIRLWDAASGTSALVSGTPSNTVPQHSACESPAFDRSGRFVSFLANASGLTADSTNAVTHAYLRDTVENTTTLLDVCTNGLCASIGPMTLTAPLHNGRFVVFDSQDENIAGSDRNRAIDIFLRDVEAGTTELVSARNSSLPSASASGLSLLCSGAVSSDGRWVAFASDANDLAPNDDNPGRYLQLFLRDVAEGTNVLVSIASSGFSGNRSSTEASLSADGRYVAFSSYASDLVAADANGKQDVFVRDMQAGATTLVSVNAAGTGSGNNPSYAPQVSGDGRFILFRSTASTLAAGGFSGENLFLRDTQTGTTYALTTAGVVSDAMTPDGRWIAYVDSAGASQGKLYVWDSLAATCISTNTATVVLKTVGISPDGNRVAFCSASGTFSVWAWDRSAGSTRQLFSAGIVPARPVLSFGPAGESLAFIANSGQVYCYDFASDSSVLVSKSHQTGAPADGASDSPCIGADGRFVAYRSKAGDLVSGDTNGIADVFLYDRQTGSNTLLSASRTGASSADGLSLAPVFSGDGRTLVFSSWASDIVANDFNLQLDVIAYSFFYASILPGSAPGDATWLWWPSTPGKTYQVQFKDNLDDPVWLDLSGTTSDSHYRSALQISTSGTSHKFYRVVSF